MSAPTPTRPLPDGRERARIRNDLDVTFFVEAAAGTGKTTELVARIVALLCSGRTTLERIVAVTFTEKAAGEMKLRLREDIEHARTTTDATVRARLDAALGQLELARIGTIHAFCADVLHERPIEAGVDPLFQVLAEDDAERLLERAFDGWFEGVLADPPPGVRRILRRRPRGREASTPRESLRAAAALLVEHRDFPAPFRRDPFDRAAAIDHLLGRLGELGALASQATWADDYLAQNLAEIQRFVEENRLREAVRGRDYDGLEAELRALLRSRAVHWHWRGSPHKPFGRELPRAEVIARRDGLKQELEQLCARCDADLAPQLQAELRAVVLAYEALKQRAGKLDFVDLLLRTRDLIVRDPEARHELQARFTHYFVDEFQDTDPLQAEILLLLAAADPTATDWTQAQPADGKLFLVGDPKQSIYRFRRADVAVYERVKRQIKRRPNGNGADVIRLHTSFRSLPAIQEAVNAAFAPLMVERENGSQAAYVALERDRDEVTGQPAIVVLPVPRPYADWGNRAVITDMQIEASLPDAVGAFVDWLLNRSGWTVTERERGRERVKIEARHVCLLFRRFKRYRDDMTRAYVRALEVRQIPHVLVGGRSFHDREEVLAIRNALCAIEWPDDELRVFATLRGPFFALGDDALLAFRHQIGSLHPLRRFESGALEESARDVADALAVLGRLHYRRNRRPIAETVGQLLAEVRAHAGIAIWPTGEQALANCLRVIALARRFERGGAPSFRAFVERMEEQAERGVAEEAPAVEEGTEGVRIMTVHRAKGLEFPVVILADPTCDAVREPPTRHLDPERGLWAEPLCGCAPVDLLEAHAEEIERDRDEAVRLTYVAATRARDLLVVPAIGDGDGSGTEKWLDALNPVIFPPADARRQPRPAPGCPPFGDDSVLLRPAAAERDREGSVAPGMHGPRAGTHAVVWWDPRVLELDREPIVGLRQQRILEADAGAVVSTEGVRAHASWQALRAARLERGTVETIRARAVTAFAEDVAQPEPVPVAIEEVVVDRRGRPHGVRFGTLVHATLAVVDLAAREPVVRQAVVAQARLLGASADEIEAAVPTVCAALLHPLIRRAAECATRGILRREAPVCLRLADGALAEGVVDLAFREERAEGRVWSVVDFKTDRDLDAALEVYRRQVALYARAIAAATGEQTAAFLLRV